MKKILLGILMGAFLLSCGNKEDTAAKPEGEKVLSVAATPEPHGEILKEAVPLMAKEGIELKVEIFNDYVMPNKVLTEKSVDANIFQHKPFLDNYNEKNGTDIVEVARSYTAPLALYSDKYKALDELKDGAEILIANDPTNLARSLILLDKNGIIKLKDSNNVVATLDDIMENPKNLKITTITADQIAIRLKEVGAAVIPGNYAVKNGLNPRESLAVESKDSPYVNIIAVLKGNENDERIQTLIKVLHSDEMKKIVEEKYQGSVMPTF